MLLGNHTVVPSTLLVVQRLILSHVVGPADWLLGLPCVKSSNSKRLVVPVDLAGAIIAGSNREPTMSEVSVRLLRPFKAEARLAILLYEASGRLIYRNIARNGPMLFVARPERL